MPTLRSPFFYVGDKYKLVPQLKEHFPAVIDRFIEPFCGGGSVFLNVEAGAYRLNDVDPYMIRLHRFLQGEAGRPDAFFEEVKRRVLAYGLSATFMGRDVPPEMRREHVKTYFARYNHDAYYRMRSDFNAHKDDLLLLYLLLIYGFNRMLRFNAAGNFNLPVGNVDFNHNVETALNAYFETIRGRDVIFECLDFQQFLHQAAPGRGDFVYCDPPYLITFSEYNKLWNKAEEERLLDTLDGLDAAGVRFAVSNVLTHKGRSNELFTAWAGKYRMVPIQSNYISYHDNTEKGSAEVLVFNY